MTTSVHPLEKILERLPSRPCSEGQAWIRSLPATTPPGDAWKSCHDARWLLWLCGQLSFDPHIFALAAIEIAKTGLPIWESRYPEDRRPHAAIETALAWTRGEATPEQARVALRAAHDAADATYANAATHFVAGDRAAHDAASAAYFVALATSAAARAAYYTGVALANSDARVAYYVGSGSAAADDAAEFTAAAAADYTSAAASVTDFAAADAAANHWRASLAHSADLVRSIVPWSEIERRLPGDRRSSP